MKMAIKRRAVEGAKKMDKKSMEPLQGKPSVVNEPSIGTGLPQIIRRKEY